MSRDRTIGVLTLVLALGVASGVVFGTVWALTVPGLPVSVGPDGAALVVDPESRARFAPVAFFALASVVVGIVLGAGAWWSLPRRRGPWLVLAVVAGALVAGVASEVSGAAVAGLRFADPAGSVPGTVLDVAPRLGTWMLASLQALGAAAALATAVSLSGDDDLGRAGTGAGLSSS